MQKREWQLELEEEARRQGYRIEWLRHSPDRISFEMFDGEDNRVWQSIELRLNSVGVPTCGPVKFSDFAARIA